MEYRNVLEAAVMSVASTPQIIAAGLHDGLSGVAMAIRCDRLPGSRFTVDQASAAAAREAEYAVRYNIRFLRGNEYFLRVRDQAIVPSK